MNESIIMGMVDPYLKGKELTYLEFKQIFSMLSLREQYGVIDILDKNGIELVDKHFTENNSEGTEEELSDDIEFKILYEDDLFTEKNNEYDKTISISSEIKDNAYYLKTRKKILLSNRALIKMIQEGDAQAKQDLCIKNYGLVVDWVKKYLYVFSNKLDFDDLVQAGMLGMIKAAEKFDLKQGTEFSTYAVWWIKQAITREVNDNGYTIRIPVHRMEQIQKVMRLDSKFAAELDYSKRIKRISEASGFPEALVEDCMQLYYQFIKTSSLDLPVGEEESSTLGELVPQETEPSIEETVALVFLKEHIKEVLFTLTEREQNVLRMRFGLDDGEERTLEEIGKEYNVTRERIRQIEEKALKKLRHPSKSKKLKGYLY